MQRSSVEEIRRALDAARTAARDTSGLDRCDVADIDELIVPIEAELRAARPNLQTLSTYLNSLAKSLRHDPANRAVCLQLDTAMRNAGVAPRLEH